MTEGFDYFHLKTKTPYNTDLFHVIPDFNHENTMKVGDFLLTCPDTAHWGGTPTLGEFGVKLVEQDLADALSPYGWCTPSAGGNTMEFCAPYYQLDAYRIERFTPAHAYIKNDTGEEIRIGIYTDGTKWKNESKRLFFGFFMPYREFMDMTYTNPPVAYQTHSQEVKDQAVKLIKDWSFPADYERNVYRKREEMLKIFDALKNLLN